MIPPVALQTERLLLRQFRESDIDTYSEWCADPEVVRYLGGKTMTRGEAWRSMAAVLGHWHLRGYGMFAVEERETGQLVGRVGPWRPEGWPGFEVGWTLHRRYWGRGYAIEAARAALDYAFNELGQEHVISLIHPENERSMRVARRLGEKHEGQTELLGSLVLIFGIDRAAWLAGQNGPTR